MGKHTAPPALPYTDLSDYFIGANHARRVAARFDVFTWHAHTLQNLA